MLVLVGGEVASGKSTLARALASALRVRPIEADLVRSEAGPSALDPAAEAAVYEELFWRGAIELDAGRSVVLDACFPLEQQRRLGRALARSRGAAFLFVACHADPRTVRERLDARDHSGGPAGWAVLHAALSARYEPLDDPRAEDVVPVRTDGPVDEALRTVLAALRGAAPVKPPSSWPSPRFVTFDCWNTLLVEDDWELAHGLRVDALHAAAAEAGRDVSREMAGQAFDAAWERHMRTWRGGAATGAHEVALWGLAELGLREPHPALEHLVLRFEEASHTSRVTSLEGAREALVGLREGGVTCALICDTGLTPGRVVRAHLERLGLLEHLAVQVFSDEAGVPKPHPRMFRSALEAVGGLPDRALHVGDLRRTDVAGARAYGMRSARITARHDDESPLPEADLVVASHAELLERIGR